MAMMSDKWYTAEPFDANGVMVRMPSSEYILTRDEARKLRDSLVTVVGDDVTLAGEQTRIAQLETHVDDARAALDETKVESDALREQLQSLRRLAVEYVEAESAYHKAHKKGEAGPGVCLRANNACAKLSAALPEIEDEVAPLTDEERARLRQIMNEQDAKREK